MIASVEMIDRVTEADVAYTIARMQVLEAVPGNPVGIAYRRIDDHTTALMARHLPSPSFNRVVGLRAGDERHIAPLDAWYREAGVAARFEMIPGHFDAALGRELMRLGYAHSAFHAALICPPGGSAAEPGEIAIEAVTTAAQMEHFLHAYVAGWGSPAKDHERFKTNVRPWLGLPGWSLYLARQAGRPAAAATLFVHGAVGYLADACTDPAFRRRGLHTALIRRRIADAHRAGADLVFSGAEFLSGSYRDMERVGLQLLFVRAIWTPTDAPT
jgi:GNAT superfamily N-acetyltransferase